MKTKTNLVAGEYIRKGYHVYELDGLAYEQEREKQLWEMLGYDSIKQCIKTVTKLNNVKQIIQRTAKYHKDEL